MSFRKITFKPEIHSLVFLRVKERAHVLVFNLVPLLTEIPQISEEHSSPESQPLTAVLQPFRYGLDLQPKNIQTSQSFLRLHLGRRIPTLVAFRIFQLWVSSFR